MRQTVFANIKDVLRQWGILSSVKINETDYRITFPNGSEMLFTGLDAEEKLLSLTDISVIWIEEAFEVEEEIFTQLNLRMRGSAKNQQIILSFNPISASSWLYTFCEINPPENLLYHHSTYKDNRFLSSEYVKTIEELKTRNPAKWIIYGEGKWGVNPEGLVFRNWETADLNPYELSSFEHRAGCDLGWIDATTVVEDFYDRENNILYITNCWYSTGAQLDTVYSAIKDMKLSKVKIQFDNAEPRTIDYFVKKGLWAVPCKKGANSIKSRISFLQNQRIIIDNKCKAVIKDFENFSYEKDKKTGQYLDDKYTHEFSHTIDALGYSVSDIYTRGKLRVVDKSLLGL